jgi:hypothetical protein
MGAGLAGFCVTRAAAIGGAASIPALVGDRVTVQLALEI